MAHEYEVALSFAGENRDFAENVARGLKKAGVKVFYDDFFTPELWGEDLSLRLRDIYYAKSRYCIMIISEQYVMKMWPNYERQQSIERLIEEGGSGYILPVRLNGFKGEVPGLSKTISFLSVSSKNPESVVSAFLKKIGKTKDDDLAISYEGERSQTFKSIIKKKFTDREKSQFLRESFEKIVGLIENFSKDTSTKYPQVEYDVERITTRKTIFTIYESGKEITRFKIWVSSSFGTDSIRFRHGGGFDMESDDSFNESFSIQEAEGELKLNPLGMLSLGTDRDKSMSPQEVAEYLWETICRDFQ